MLVAEDLGYSGEALEMKVSSTISLDSTNKTDDEQVPNYHAPGEMSGIASLRL